MLLLKLYNARCCIASNSVVLRQHWPSRFNNSDTGYIKYSVNHPTAYKTVTSLGGLHQPCVLGATSQLLERSVLNHKLFGIYCHFYRNP